MTCIFLPTTGLPQNDSDPYFSTPLNQPSYINLRLTGGKDPAKGVVEIAYMGIWGVMCVSPQASLGDVICRQLGYRGSQITTVLSDRDLYLWAKRNVYSTYARRDVHLADNVVTCQGSEDNLAECDLGTNAFGEKHRCDTSQDSIFVVCRTKTEGKSDPMRTPC